MSRRCELTAKGPQVGHTVSHSNIKTKRRFLPNLCNVTFISDTLGRNVRLRVSTNAIKSVDHRGGFDAFLIKAKGSELSPKALGLKRAIEKKKAGGRRRRRRAEFVRSRFTWSFDGRVERPGCFCFEYCKLAWRSRFVVALCPERNRSHRSKLLRPLSKVWISPSRLSDFKMSSISAAIRSSITYCDAISSAVRGRRLRIRRSMISPA